MKQRTFILTFLLIVATFLGCHNDKAQGYVETKIENSEKKVCAVPCERNDTVLWDTWFKKIINRTYTSMMRRKKSTLEQ